MEISDFILRKTLNSDDCLLGYDNNGRGFRIKVQDLKNALGISTVKAESIIAQYSTSGKSWHSSYIDGDRYMRVKCGVEPWSVPICISVSAYEIWREHNGGNGTVEEFLESLQGEAGESVDVTKLQISEMGGYKEFVAQQSGNTEQALADFGSVLNQKFDAIEKRLSAMDATDERVVIALTGDKNGKNVVFGTKTSYVIGSSQLFIDGKRCFSGSDYLETSDSGIVMLTHIPDENDVLVFIAVKKPLKD